MKNILFLILFYFLSFSQNRETGVLYGEDHVYSLSAPIDWVLDNKSGAEQGLHAVFYPKGGSWSASPCVMYTNVILKKYEKVKDSKEFLSTFISDYKSRDKGNKAELYKTLVFKEKKDVDIYKYYDNKYKNNELVAYIDEEKTIIMIVLVSQNEDLFIKNEDNYIELIKSYKFISDDFENFLKKYKAMQEKAGKN